MCQRSYLCCLHEDITKLTGNFMRCFCLLIFIFKPSSCDTEEAVPPIRWCVQSVGVGGSGQRLELRLMMWDTK